MAPSTPTCRNGDQGGSDGEQVAGPLYTLDDVRSRCAAGKVTFSKRAQAGFEAEGFSKQSAIECVASLTEGEYRKSLRYEGQQPFDAYSANRISGRHAVYKQLYIKFRIPSPSVVDQVYVTSFHP
ncbi:type II toxin-antitoxin system MqsR family toxin [Xanthomonas sp. WCS2018Cala2-21]|uniref:type II toxin-antitoxin system MqsR family toxin n=1 Tax=Xanthomonas sp. WCS2018Cala2-21 TaxID=3073644 RepID=UPI00387E2230